MLSNFDYDCKNQITIKILFGFGINEWYDIGQPSFALILELFCITSNLSVSGFSCRICSTFESSQLKKLSTDLEDSGN